jgi:mannosylglucosylglycerate synthase
MHIGFLSTRLHGTDGVSLEVEKWAAVLGRMGHQVSFCAGELGGCAAGGMLIPKLHFTHPAILALTHSAFDDPAADPQKLRDLIFSQASELRPAILDFLRQSQLDLLILQNVMAIPMNLPLGVALSQVIGETGIRTIAHHHDFYWERARYQASPIPDVLDAYFPADLPTIQHVTINSIAQQRLLARRGLVSTVIPNVHDFAVPPPPIDAYTQDFRRAIGLQPEDRFILQPTRIIQRKGIELAIELVKRMDLPAARLVITHSAGDEGLAYWNWLQREASVMGVDLRLIDHLIADARSTVDGRKRYTLWDAYPHADLVTYPSLYEGFGNALLETIYFKRPAVVNRYAVYNADIRSLGFQFIELDGYVDAASVARARALLDDPAEARRMAEHNYALAREHFSLQVLASKLQGLLGG